MNVHTWFSFAVAPALVAPLLVLDLPQTDAGLVRVQASRDAHSTPPTAQDWKARLTAPDLDQRERNYDEFVRALQRDPDLRREAREWSRSADSELAWTTRLALRASPAADSRGLGLGRNFGRIEGLRAQFGDLQRQFGDLDRLFEDFQRRLDLGSAGVGVMPHDMKSEMHSYSLQVTPDGVKVEVNEDVDGQVEKKTYEAKTLDELYEAHPELKDKVRARVDRSGSPRLRFGLPRVEDDPFGGMRLFDDLDPDQRPALPLVGGMRTDILGFSPSAPTVTERETLKLEPDVGLKVESVLPETIAAKIGLAVGDVVIDVNGHTVKSAADVAAALAARRSGEAVNVIILDASGQRRTLTWQPGRPSGA